MIGELCVEVQLGEQDSAFSAAGPRASCDGSNFSKENRDASNIFMK